MKILCGIILMLPLFYFFVMAMKEKCPVNFSERFVTYFVWIVLALFWFGVYLVFSGCATVEVCKQVCAPQYEGCKRVCKPEGEWL